MYALYAIHRSRTQCARLMLLALPIALGLPATPVAANIAPEATVTVHVRAAEPPGQAGCTIPGITSCGFIVNSTTLTGELEFDIFAQPWPVAVPDHVSHLLTSFTFPNSWQFIRWEPCGSVNASYVSGNGTATLEAFWPDCPQVDEVLLVGRVTMDVTGYGRFQPSYNGILDVNCSPTTSLHAVGVFAEAGVTCDYTRLYCTPTPYCQPTLSQTEVLFNSGPGGALAADIPFDALNYSGGTCSYVPESGASWLSASYEMTGYNEFMLHVVSHPAGLAPGTYTTQLSLTTGLVPMTRRCLGVTLEIPATSAAPGGGEPARQVQESWGVLKAGYR